MSATDQGSNIMAVSGEWIGFEADYRSDDGRLKGVPEWQMPGSLLEWGVVRLLFLLFPPSQTEKGPNFYAHVYCTFEVPFSNARK
jgi:hypothetical protein